MLQINAGSNLISEFTFEEYIAFTGYQLADPTNPVVTVTDPVGTDKVTSQAATQSSTGKYFYEIATATDWVAGIYTVKVVSDEDVTVHTTAFEII